MFTDVESFLQSATGDSSPPDGLSPEALSIWHIKAGNWEASHDIAQDIDSSMGSWIHAHLHLIEGDIGNAGYWYSRAGKPARKPAEIEAEWLELATAVLG